MKAHKHTTGLLLAFILVMIVTAAGPAIRPPAARAGIIPPLPTPCDFVPDGAARTACKVVANPISAAGTIAKAVGIPTPTDVVDNVAQAIVAPILNQIARAEADAVNSVLKDITNFVNNSSTPTLTADWFLRLYAIVFGMAIPAALILFYLRVGQGVRNQDFNDIGGAFFSLMVMVIGGGLIPGVVGLLVNLMDNNVAPAWMATAGASANDTLSNLGVNFTKSLSFSNNPVTPVLLPLIFLFAGLIGGLLIELMMLFREAMLYFVTAGAIVALAMYVGGRSSGTLFRHIQKLAVLVLFKVIVAFTLTIGLLLLGSSTADPVLLGSVVLMMVPVLTWATYRNWAEHDIRFLPGGWAYTKRAAGYISSMGSS